MQDNYPFVVHADGRCSFLDRGGLILGAFSQAAYESGSVQLEPDDIVMFFTDGLSDLRDLEGNDFGEERILELVREHNQLGAEALKNELLREAKEFSSGELGFDDLTMIVLKITSTPRESV